MRRAVKVSFLLASIRLWWAQVTVTPEANNTAVFSRGIWKGLKAMIIVGGQIAPNSPVGVKLLWKKAQKNETKKKISDTINKIIPHFKPKTTFKVCKPWKEPSRIISRHHTTEVMIRIKIPRKNNKVLFKWNIVTNPLVRIRAPKEANKGQGLLSTKW